MISRLFIKNKTVPNEVNSSKLNYDEKYAAVLNRINLNSEKYDYGDINRNIRNLESQVGVELKYLRERTKNRESIRDQLAPYIVLSSGVLGASSLYFNNIENISQKSELLSNYLENGAICALTLAGICNIKKSISYINNYLKNDKEELEFAEYRKSKVVKSEKYENRDLKTFLTSLSFTVLLSGVPNTTSLEKIISFDTDSPSQNKTESMTVITQRNKKLKRNMNDKYEQSNNIYNKDLKITSKKPNEVVLISEFKIDENKNYISHKLTKNNSYSPFIKSDNTILDVLKFNIDDNHNFSKDEREKLWKVENRIEYALNVIENENLTDLQIGEIYTQVESMKEKLLKKKTSQIKKEAFKTATNVYNQDKLIPNRRKIQLMSGYTDHLVNEYNNGNKEIFSTQELNRINKIDSRLEKVTELENRILGRDFISKVA
jgi:hypothetical protein